MSDQQAEGRFLPPRPGVFAPQTERTTQSELSLRQAQARYQQEQVLSASPERLLTMLYDRLVLDIERAESAQVVSEWQAASGHLKHAQSIVSELNGTLTSGWDGASDLRAIYAHLTDQLIQANIRHDIDATRHCRELVTPLRDAWHAAAAATAKAAAAVGGSGA